ncbi:UNVERIFIED_CONTAM: hypothetical protein BEN50_05950 [Euhalothece sp. KZN 001]
MNDLIEALMLNGGTLINEFAQSNLFFSGLETAFGTDYEIETAETLQAMLTDGTFLDELGMEVLPSSALNGALGAYASATNTIYLSSALEGFSLEVTTAVFLEEVGHAVDAFLNTTDSAGDEGAIFSALVRGKPLSEEKLAGLRQEDDFSTIVVDGEEIIIEQATLTVDTETDENDGDFSAGDLSLREAIDSIAPGGTITFADGINTITLDEALGELVIDKGLTIDGDLDDDGSPDVTVERASEATAEFRIFNISDGNDANAVTVTLDGLTISGGIASGDGGGILNNENLTLSNSTVSGNSALFGGGIYNGYYYATANVTNSTVSGNFATGSGGGIFNYSGTANVTNSTVSGNSATNDAGGIYSGFDGIANITNSTISDNSATNGGGINSGFNGTANITNSTISDNFATGNGGGIYNNFATANVTNSTVSGNSATGNGGGIYNGNYGTANVTNSTVSGNSATNGGGIYNYEGTANVTNSTLSGNSATNGGGIYNSYYGTANITNSIVANSVGDDLSRDTGTINASYSLIENNADQINGTNSNNITGQDPNLDPALQDNGGVTQTIALLADSPAIDAGDNDLIPTGVDFDQRGDGFDRIVNGTVDIGAFESLSFALEVDTETDENDGLEAGDGISLRDAIESIAPGGTITFADGINTITLDEALGELVIDKGLTIDGDLDDDGSPDVTVERASDATAEFRIFNINDGNDANAVTVTLDGLTVTGGVAGGSSVIGTRGGGISNFEDLTLTNSTVSGNSSFVGGGVYNRGTSTINNSTLSGNSADNGGGGVANTGTSTITINNSILSSNSSDAFGGGVVNYGTSTITINNSTLSSNSARYGGGVNNSGTSTINNSTLSGNSARYGDGGGIDNGGTSTINNSTLSGNSARYGGGVNNNGTSTIDNSTLSGNSAAESGGGIDNGGTSTITNSTLSGNSANFGGGIDNNYLGTSTITNSTLSGNSSSQNGGGVNNYGTSTINNSTLSGNSAYNGGGVDNSGTANVTNSTISGNSATNGGGIYNRGRVFNLIQGTANITNSIVANSVGDDLSRDTGTINASYSLIENNADQINGTNANNITGQDPLLDPAGLQDNGGPTQTIALLADSPAIDAGDNDLIPTGVDFDQRGTGFDRIVNGTVDIGAFESLSLVVDTLIDEVDGSVTDGDISLRDALSAIAPGETITFADGINTITLDEALGELVIDKGLTIDGDLDDDGSPDVTVQRASEATAEFRIFNIDDGNDANAVTVTLDGLTVTGGVASGSVPNNRGGGIFNNREDLTLTNSTVSGNSAADSGGGIYNYYGTANVTNSTVSGNSSLLGGGVGNNGTSTINNSTLSDNSADFAGSGVFNYGTSTINNSTLSGNSADFIGGGIYNNGTSTITNSTLSDNSANFGGGVSVSNNGTSTINNSTLSGNSAAESGGGIDNAGTANITNSIVANSVGDDLSRNGGTINASYSLIENNADQINGTDDNNITGQDPNLDPAGLQDNGGPTQTIALLAGSPAIDAGDNDLIPAGVDFEQRGTGFARIVNGTVDIGAFESPLVVDTLIDEVDGSVTDGDISLRDALSAIAPGGTITFADGINTITLDEALGELVIDKGLTIDGDLDDDGSPDVTVERASDATAEFRIFRIDDGDNANEVTVTLDGLTVTGGVASTTAPGGGIFNDEDLTLTNSTVSGNSAGGGGGVVNNGTSTINNSTLSGNSATFGGGVVNNGTSTITNSTISGNSTSFRGGGIDNTGTSTINNSTLSGNSASIRGGGIHNRGTSTINNSTLSDNSATNGGGIYNANDGTANITNSIVANSVGDDLSRDTGTINASYSLIENNADQINGTDDNNITGQDPLLDPAGLQDNGGPTQTIALLVDSPAIDAGDNNLIPAGVDFDQRGTGFDRIVNGTVDIGAFEVQTLSLTITDDSATEGSDIATFELTRDVSSDALDVLLNFTSFTLQTSDFSFDQGSINQAQLTVSFAAGETTQTVTVTAVDDTEDEPDGSFDLILAASNAYDISATDNTGTINILDNDPAPPQKVSLNPTDETASEGGGSAGFEVIRSDSNGALTVEVTIGGSASSTDYNFDQGTVSGSTLTLNFADGEDILNVSVDPVDDPDNESPEFVTLALANSANYTINQFDNSAQLTIADNDNSVTAIEGTSGRETLTGTTGDDMITGGGGRDTLTGGGGEDRFVYNSLTDASDIITDFGAAGDAEQDILDFVSLFDSLGISSTDPIDDGFVTFTEFNGSAIVNLDQDGSGTSSTPRPYLLLQNVLPSEVDGSDFAFS